MINLEVPKKAGALINQAYQAAAEVFRPISRKYDRAEHTYPAELDMFAALLDGLNSSGEGGAGAAGVRRSGSDESAKGNRNGANLNVVLGTIEMCWGDVGLLLSMPRQGLGNAAIGSVATDEQLERFSGMWAAMAITEPAFGSDSAAVSTTARLDGDHYVLNGEKIFVTSGERADAVVVWATLDKSKGRAAIKSFVVEKGTPGFEVVRTEHKLGIRASDTAVLRFENCRVPKENLLGTPEIDTKKGFAGVMQTFDNTRPLVAAMAIGVARAALEETKRILTSAGVTIDYDRPANAQHAAAAEFLRLEADYESAYLLTLESAWMADNRQPNSLQASMAKAKAGRSVVEIALKCVELTGAYSEESLLEKWARDAKILDIFEGTQQIQQLIVARRILGKTSAELK
ncbi:acyl-CoA dehydrogenase [Amycolatopsis mediterranei S699]|uniref:Acyl-CoA dehydrogenase n=3 Tax=Amycolatopsis mediterranei TaxID=33910 RepID=A0A0H3DIV0_AMYMU|nr:acyl-CoA dehydrogenase family protein [Amycolatopsis mediterranei]ADJ49609.1 acyl-CoA dehydrogenase [Amycolatopsis mediterranei U32]AEK46590.1 acyl-CoA dehydrogenase [Amycolatopsis mediterranei S699]AFO81318.1 acyl-CoA dehydrogenase [Amycolatopsis mediterranei S699]AGT88446.1 acyl-CoA dehydrogenase [Amycolatopsis mediterranei RB]KDO12759.1 acyl-CoA dehydrogenase [Amycolatopsis mediterranei]